MNRGDRREPILQDNQDRERFLETLGEACGKTGWHVHAWCLMGNHYHMVIGMSDGNLSKGMRQLNTVYTQTFNKRQQRVGHVFSGKYKALLIEKRELSPAGFKICGSKSRQGKDCEKTG